MLPAMISYMAVALPVPADRLFTYASNSDLSPLPGSRVLVPFGKQTLTGIVVSHNVSPVPGVREILEVLDDTPALTDSLMKLGAWISEYYLCSPGEAYFAILPSGFSPHSVITVSLNHYISDSEMLHLSLRAPRRAALLEVLSKAKGPLSVGYLQKELGVKSITDQLHALQLEDIISINVQLRGKRSHSVVETYAPAARLSDDTELNKVLDDLERKAPLQGRALGTIILHHLHTGKPADITELRRIENIELSVVKRLISKGLVEVTHAPPSKPSVDIQGRLATVNEFMLPLTEQQVSVVATLQNAIEESRFQVCMLEGVTGSGKTIVYMHILKKVLESGNSGLLLVPEISLTPQLTDRFLRSFGENVVVVHSQLSASERINSWRVIREGKATIVLGPRSALFSPLANTGVIIVDEEHEPSYKQDDPAPRYHGRDTAIKMASIVGCPVILGSATPSLESRYNTEHGHYRLLNLTQRSDGAVMPSLSIVDIRREQSKGRMEGNFSSVLVNSIMERVDKNEGTIIFHNRRGYASFQQCDDCGFVMQCPNCSVSLTVHRNPTHLRCHYCNHVEEYTTACRECGGVLLSETGTGTQRLCEELEIILKRNAIKASIQRLDTDVVRGRYALRNILERFSHGELDILVGTQMIAKGLDIARVTLVGVTNADSLLFQGSFRAAERTWQLLTQVAGRAGRTKDRPGSVVIQTHQPNHPVLSAVVTGSVDEWRDSELSIRSSAGYPPFTRLHVIEVSGQDEGEVEKHASIIYRLAPKELDFAVFMQPVQPVLSKVRNRWRRLIVVKSIKDKDPAGVRCRIILRRILDQYRSKYAGSSVRVTIDIDTSGIW